MHVLLQFYLFIFQVCLIQIYSAYIYNKLENSLFWKQGPVRNDVIGENL